MSGLNVVALISGGKDSFFSILHCQANGHNVIALANLHPPTQDQNEPVDDLESFMYQTIGHQVIPCYEHALGLPLYRQEIQGVATCQRKDYAADCVDDETESLLPLLRQVIAAHPEVNAISTGAILSDYQRTRVESVALRLGLTPLSYLWQWPFLPPATPRSLLEDMAAVGQDARIIKVASGGLDESFLWQNVASPKTIARLTKAAQKFGSPDDGAVLGEGGEYETLTVAGPAPLWKGRLLVAQHSIDIIPGEAGSSSVRITKPCVEFFDQSALAQPPPAPRAPQLLSPHFQLLQTTLCSAIDLDSDQTHDASPIPSLDYDTGDYQTFLEGLTGEGSDVDEQTRSIMEHVKSQLGASLCDVTYAVIVLRSMSDFLAFNAIYGSYFTRPTPPARLTIACADVLPVAALLSIDIFMSPGPRDGLHVQSRSYWAPANIGPYSQAIRHTRDHKHTGVETSIFVAGQIPLIPASMQLPSATSSSHAHFTLQSVLALQHLDRIGRVMHVNYWVFAIAFIAAQGIDDSVLSQRARIAQKTWTGYHQEGTSGKTTQSDGSDDEEFDVWHLTHGSGKPWVAQTRSSSRETTGPNLGSTIMPQLLVITADALPRNADIEWVAFGRNTRSEDDKAVPVHLRSLVRAFAHRILR